MRSTTLPTIKKSLLPIILGVIMLLGPCATTAEAFSLEVPETTFEDYQAYDGIKMFVNGRYVEFNDEVGYPYIENGTMMISLAAVEKGLGGHTELKKSSEVVISKYDRGVQFKDNEVSVVRYACVNNEYSSRIEPVITRDTVTLDVGITSKGEVVYVPLRPLFEAFGLAVRWEQETRTVNIEIPEPATAFPNIDFKDAEVISIQDLDTDTCKTLRYDGQVVEASYIPLLKNSSQYSVVLTADAAHIFSYQYLSDLNYLYGKAKEWSHATESILLYRPSEAEREFVRQTYRLMGLHEVGGSIMSSTGLRPGDDPSLRSWFLEKMIFVENSIELSLEETQKKVHQEAQRIAAEIKKQTSIPKEQAILATQILHKKITYGGDGQGAYEALVRKEAVCAGFSCALQFVLDELEILSVRIGGVTERDGEYFPHAWNHVFVDGEWYLFDATWGVWMKPLDDFLHRQDDEEIAVEQLMLMTYRF